LPLVSSHYKLPCVPSLSAVHYEQQEKLSHSPHTQKRERHGKRGREGEREREEKGKTRSGLKWAGFGEEEKGGRKGLSPVVRKQP